MARFGMKSALGYVLRPSQISPASGSRRTRRPSGVQKHLKCISTASLWHVFHFYPNKAGVVASQLGLLAATSSVQCQRLHWIKEIFGHPIMYGTSGFEAIIDR